ncbi:organelle RRM domain-containing protein 1, chloroplastic isoform X1 [Tanacetum coccineum]
MAYQTMAQSISSSVIHFFSRTSFETADSLSVKPPTQHQEAGSSSSSSTRQYVVDYYATILDKVLVSEKDAQGCIYNVSCDTHFGFCCHVDEETSQQLACLPEVLSVKPDPNFETVQKDYSHEKAESGSYNNIFLPLFPAGSSKHWLVRVEIPESRIITRAQLVDHYTQILTNVLGNEKDAQMCIYNVSLQSDYGFCCELDDECAKELAGVRSVTSVTPDVNVGSDDKDYGGSSLQHSNIKTKKLFVTGLSFYTSEKTLRAAFEGFGELVEVKIIMDKISKRSKGFAFIEYTTEEAASAALREMNGKIINGWMIVVDVAKTNPPNSINVAISVESFPVSSRRHNGRDNLKLFVFGDSYVDTGNWPKTYGGSWHEPYGITFPGSPSGRFSDGRVLTDYIGASC